MRILVINGNPKTDGFTAGALNIIGDHLGAKGVQVNHLRLADAQIQDCRGCFNCLKTGSCVINDDINGIMQGMIEADGFVIGSPVRNGLITACYKRFYERITYGLGFTLLLEDKHTLAISSVGIMGGKSINKKFLGLQDVCRARLSDFLFFKVGFPNKLSPAEVRDKLEHAADRLVRNIESRRKKRLFDRIAATIDRIMLRKFMLMKSPEHYAFVIKCWKQKGYIKEGRPSTAADFTV